MMPRTTVLALAGALLTGGSSGCAGARLEPELASPATQAGYAQTYPEALTAAATGFSSTQTEVRDGVRGFGEFPDRLKKPGWGRVREIIKSADQAGRSYLYVEQIRRVDGAFGFLAAEKEEIVNKVSGAVQAAARKKGCDLDAASAVGLSFKEAVDKELQKELREANEGHLLIDRYRALLGPENAAALEKQVDVVSRLSYLVHVELVEEKLRIKRMLDEADDIRRTYEGFAAAERELQADKRISAADKQASVERVEQMNKSRALLDSALKQGDDLLPKLDEQLSTIQREYEQALFTLLVKIENMPRVEGQ